MSETLWRVVWTDANGEEHVLWTYDADEAKAKAEEVKGDPRLTLQAWDSEDDYC